MSLLRGSRGSKDQEDGLLEHTESDEKRNTELSQEAFEEVIAALCKEDAERTSKKQSNVNQYYHQR